MNRICFISHKSSLGGAETSLLSSVIALRKEGFKCYVILPSLGPLEERLRRENIEYKVVFFKHWVTAKPSFLKKQARKLANRFAVPFIAYYLKDWHIDVVITNTLTPVSGALAAKKRNIPHIWHIREFGEEDHNYTFDRGLEQATTDMEELSDLIICNSKAVAEKYRSHITPQKIKVLYNTVPIDNNYCSISSDSLFRNSSSFKCIMIGSVSKRKNQMEAIRSLNKLNKEKSVRIELLLVGPYNPDYKKKLDYFIQDQDLENYVSFTGELRNPYPILKRSDVLLMCSKMEAFGKVSVEAMKCGIPVIGANTGGTTELIKHKHTGLLYELGNVNNLAEMIFYLIENPDHSLQLARNAYENSINRFTIEEYGDKYHKMINEVLQ